MKKMEQIEWMIHYILLGWDIFSYTHQQRGYLNRYMIIAISIFLTPQNVQVSLNQFFKCWAGNSFHLTLTAMRDCEWKQTLEKYRYMTANAFSFKENTMQIAKDEFGYFSSKGQWC